jgi:hypothetical protein
MLPSRTGILAIVSCMVGCATADLQEPDHGGAGGGADAHLADGPRSDAAGGGGHPDAPASSGTCATAYSGVLATWVLTSATGNQASTAASGLQGGVTAGALTRSSGLTAVSGAGSINSSNWATSAQPDTTKYYTFSITPPAGCTLTLSAASVDAKASSTGPASAALGTSNDAYGATQAVSTSAATAVSLHVNAVTTAVELRVYGYAASATTGTFRIQNTLSLTGAIQ